jgi:hypothetical protein
VSREYLFSLVVSEHDPARADAIAAAVAGWLNEGASEEHRVRRTDANGSLAFEFHVGMGGGWPVLGHAKSVTLRVGQANGGPCRVEWAAWLLDMPQLTLELPAGTTGGAPEHDAPAGSLESTDPSADVVVGDAVWSLGNDTDHTTQRESPEYPFELPDSDPEGAGRARRLYLQITVHGPRDAAVVMDRLRSADTWTDDPHGHGYDDDTHVDAAIVLPVGHTLRAHAERWLSAIEAGHGERVKLWVGASDLDRPTEARVFEPGCFPIQEPERLVEPKNWLAMPMPLGAGDDRCGFCGSVQGLRWLGTWAPPEVRALAKRNAARWATEMDRASDRPSNPSVCRSCLETILARLAPAAGVRSGLFETDGNPFGAADRPDLPCMTCATPATEEIVVLNYALTFAACRGCLRRAADELAAADARAAERRATRRRARSA